MSIKYSKKPGFRTTALEALDGADLSGKVAIVTGSNSGLGLEHVKALSRGGAKTFLCSRSIAKGEAALDSVKSPALKGEIVVAELDVDDFDSISKFSSKFLSNETRLDYLVLNAGVMMCPLKRTKHGFEQQIGTNYFGHYFLVQKLLPLMVKQDFQSRIIMISSEGHKLGNIDLDDLNFLHRPYSPYKSYGQSKTAMILWAKILAQKLKESNVLVYSVHPGIIFTSLYKELRTGISWLDNAMQWFVERVAIFLKLAKTVPQGAGTQMYACVAKDIENDSGDYLYDCALQYPLAYAQDMNQAEKLIQVTEETIKKVETDGTIS